MFSVRARVATANVNGVNMLKRLTVSFIIIGLFLAHGSWAMEKKKESSGIDGALDNIIGILGGLFTGSFFPDYNQKIVEVDDDSSDDSDSEGDESDNNDNSKESGEQIVISENAMASLPTEGAPITSALDKEIGHRKLIESLKKFGDLSVSQSVTQIAISATLDLYNKIYGIASGDKSKPFLAHIYDVKEKSIRNSLIALAVSNNDFSPSDIVYAIKHADQKSLLNTIIFDNADNNKTTNVISLITDIKIYDEATKLGWTSYIYDHDSCDRTQNILAQTIEMGKTDIFEQILRAFPLIVAGLNQGASVKRQEWVSKNNYSEKTYTLIGWLIRKNYAYLRSPNYIKAAQVITDILLSQDAQAKNIDGELFGMMARLVENNAMPNGKTLEDAVQRLDNLKGINVDLMPGEQRGEITSLIDKHQPSLKDIWQEMLEPKQTEKKD